MIQKTNHRDSHESDYLHSRGGISMFTIASALAIAYVFCGCNKGQKIGSEQESFTKLFNEWRSEKNIYPDTDFRLIRDNNDTTVFYEKVLSASRPSQDPLERIITLTNNKTNKIIHENIGFTNLYEYTENMRNNLHNKPEEREKAYKFLKEQLEKGIIEESQ